MQKSQIKPIGRINPTKSCAFRAVNRELDSPATGTISEWVKPFFSEQKKTALEEYGIQMILKGRFPVKSIASQISQKALESLKLPLFS